jgi:hypothetical protein
MLKRQRDARGPSYPPFVVNEPVAEVRAPPASRIVSWSTHAAALCAPLTRGRARGGGQNYYPVNSMISLDDGKTEMAVVCRVVITSSVPRYASR